MKVLWSAYYEFIKNIRDIRVLFVLIAFPISIIILLGTAFDGNLTEDFKNRVKSGYVIPDNGQVGSGVKQLLEADDIKKVIDSVSYSTEVEAIKAMDEGKIDNYIVIPEDTSRKLENRQEAEIRIEGKKNIELVNTVLNSYIYSNNALSIAAKLTENNIEYQETNGVQINNNNQEANGARISNAIQNSNDIQKPGEIWETFERITPADTKLPEAIDYYSVLTLLQVVTMGSILGILIVTKNQESNIHIRLYALPTSKWTILWGKVIGNSIFLFLSCVVTVIFTKFVYHANWEGNLFIIGLVLIVLSFISIGMGIMIHSFTNSFVPALGISFLIMLFSSVAGGAITPAVTIQSLNIINPIYYSKVLIFGAIYNYPGIVMYKAAGGLLAILAVIYITSILKLRKVNYDNI